MSNKLFIMESDIAARMAVDGAVASMQKDVDKRGLGTLALIYAHFKKEDGNVGMYFKVGAVLPTDGREVDNVIREMESFIVEVRKQFTPPPTGI